MELEWTRPVGLVALAIPVALVLLSLRRGRPASLPVGTFRLWRGLESEVEGPRTRRHLPLARLLLIAGLTLAALALGGPRRAERSPDRTWHVILDTRPAMFLTHTTSEGVPSGQGTRMDAALAALGRMVEGESVAPRLLWSRHNGASGALERVPGSAPPADFLRPGAAPVKGLDWSGLDEPDTVWVRDRLAPREAPVNAGWALSGGGAVAGAVASVGETALLLDGTDWVERPGLPSRVVVLDPDLPQLVRSFGRVWADQRGLGIAGEDPRDGTVALRLVAGVAPSGEGSAVMFGRDGWTGSARVPDLASDPGSGVGSALTWLSARVGGVQRALVTWGPGEVRVRFGDPFTDSIPGSGARDPGTFAVSWGDLLDSAVLPAEGIVSAEGRADAGKGGSRAPRSGAGGGGLPDSTPSWPLVALLSAASAALLFAAGLAVRA